MIDLIAVKKTYAGRTVLSVPQFSFVKGERYALIGANGSGKSTLLRLLAGTIRPDEGSIRGIEALAGRVGYLPQSPYAFDLSVLGNVQLPLGGGPKARQAALSALERVGLTALASARANRLSGGETQRMALARVLARPCALLLLDEPSSATDVAAEKLIERTLLEYCAESGCTLIFSSHAPAQALRLSTQAVYMEQGQIVESGPSARLLNNPESESARTFLGHWRIA